MGFISGYHNQNFFFESKFEYTILQFLVKTVCLDLISLYLSLSGNLTIDLLYSLGFSEELIFRVAR